MSWLAVELYRRGMVKIGEFTLSSGIKSPFYIDLRRLYSYPELARRVVSELASRIPMDRVDVIAGIETAGIPLATYLALHYQ
jgi:orotate phosphoribosyltransferase